LTKCFTSSFYARRTQQRKKTLLTWLSFLRFWNLHAYKLRVKCSWNWHQSPKLKILLIFQRPRWLIKQISKIWFWKIMSSCFYNYSNYPKKFLQVKKLQKNSKFPILKVVQRLDEIGLFFFSSICIATSNTRLTLPFHCNQSLTRQFRDKLFSPFLKFFFSKFEKHYSTCQQWTGRCQFHQHFTRSFFANILAPKKFQTQNAAL